GPGDFDNAGMGAARDDHEALAGLHDQRLLLRRAAHLPGGVHVVEQALGAADAGHTRAAALDGLTKRRGEGTRQVDRDIAVPLEKAVETAGVIPVRVRED